MGFGFITFKKEGLQLKNDKGFLESRKYFIEGWKEVRKNLNQVCPHCVNSAHEYSQNIREREREHKVYRASLLKKHFYWQTPLFEHNNTLINLKS